jgi:hypothetical protein
VIGLVVALVVVLVLLALIVITHVPPPDQKTYRALVELHGIRRRLELARFKSQVRGDAARARRELRDDLESKARRGWR